MMKLQKLKKKTKLKYLLDNFYSCFKTIETGDILKFAENNRYLSKNESPIPGFYKPFPYQSEIYDVLRRDNFQELVLVWASQTAKSLTMENISLYYMAAENASVLYAWPNARAADKCATEKITPMLENSPEISKLLVSRTRSKDNKKTYKKLRNGSYIRIIGCTPSELAGESVRVVIADEIDRMKDQGEGDPVSLLHRRCAAYHNRVKISASTPTYIETSKIWSKFLDGSQAYYYIKSKRTGKFFKLEWKDFRIDRDDIKLSTLIDPTNGQPLSDDDRKWGIYNGEWRHNNTECGVYSYHLSGLYRVTPTTKGYVNPYHEWAQHFLSTETDNGKLTAFCNTFLALPVENKIIGEKLDYKDYNEHLLSMDLDNIPDEIVAITSGTDIQANRKETYVYGWTKDYRGYMLDYKMFDGEPQDEKTWIDLEEFLNKEYKRLDGKKLKIMGSFIDSGNWQSTVLNFTDKKAYKGIYAIKGVANAMLVDKTQNRKKQWIIGTNEAKDYIFSDYSLGRLKFNQTFADKDFFDQLFSEIRTNVNGKNQYDKKSSGKRNEALDTLVYALACVKRHNFIKNCETSMNWVKPEKIIIDDNNVQQNQPVQKKIENIQKKYIPNYLR